MSTFWLILQLFYALRVGLENSRMTKASQQKIYRQYCKFYLLFYCLSEWRQNYFVNLTLFGKFLLYYVSAVSRVQFILRLEDLQYGVRGRCTYTYDCMPKTWEHWMGFLSIFLVKIFAHGMYSLTADGDLSCPHHVLVFTWNLIGCWGACDIHTGTFESYTKWPPFLLF